jgi:hypothetical protein
MVTWQPQVRCNTYSITASSPASPLDIYSSLRYFSWLESLLFSVVTFSSLFGPFIFVFFQFGLPCPLTLRLPGLSRSYAFLTPFFPTQSLSRHTPSTSI